MDDPSPSKKPALAIDLNEAPPSPPPSDPLPPTPPPPPPLPQPNPTEAADALSLVLKFHGNPKAAGEPAAGFPGEAGVGRPRMCGICLRPEVFGGTVVCDGCETGFHLGCLRSRQRQQALSGDWACGECALTGPTQKRWVLGAAKLLDINEPPPRDEEESGRMTNRDEVYSNGSIGRQHLYPNMVQVGSVFDIVNHSGIMADTMQTGDEAIPHHGLNTSRGFEDHVLGSSVGGMPVLSRATRSGPFTEEVFLNTLKNFILEKGGFLGEGWHVEFVQSPYGFSNPFALYCAPDGKKFESMYDVAQYLGISSSFIPVEIDERSDGCGSVRRALPPRRRKKVLARISATSRFTERRDNVGINSREELCSDKDFITQYYDANSASRVAKPYMEENGVDESPDLSAGLPLQYEDFFVLRLGRIDLRPAYHDNHQIWPIGYRSMWHDKITGSLFQCEVSDGGDSGPVFKVRRSPCSLSPIPTGETILLHNKLEKADISERIERTNVIFDASSNEEDILMLLSDPNPLEQEIFSCFGHDIGLHPYESSEQMDVEKPDRLTNNSNNHHGRTVHPSGKSCCLRDEIGEFYVEGRSSSSVWKMVSRTLIDACHEVYKQSGCLQFCCRHKFGSSCSDGGNLKDVLHTGPLGRFCCACGPIETPRVIQNDIELEASFVYLAEWLEQDRFGLDMGFVQEIIENLPASRSCSQYHCLIDKSDFKSSHTVGNGLLLPIQKSGKIGDTSYGLYSGNNGSKQLDLPEDPPLADARPPPGQPLSSKLPGELVGDVFQIWEFLWRFYEVLGLKEPLSFEELEEELIDPWPCDLNHLKKIEKDNQDCRDPVSLGTESANYSVSLSTSVTDSTTHGQNSCKLIPVETATTREATQIKVASCTYGSCNGVALTKAHISLLKVLVGELLNKVAVFLDPNFDARDSKPKRGRRKDTDSSPVKESKHGLLTVNELTWPELARRYALAVLSMNGRTEDVSSRESLRVYRCLQGDGGVLCGSLSGIAGMEADALLLADAEKQISGSTKQDNTVFTVDYKDTSTAVTCEPAVITSNNLPEWAQPLEPVRKLPTNVGTRIRKCVYSSLEKNPPEWAKEILEHSISKEVYKGNASGPTKKAVLSILAKLTTGTQQQKPEKASSGKTSLSVSDIIMKKCRSVLRSAVSADESKTFCNLLGTTLLSSSDNNEKGILGSPAMVSRPLDFRTIDLRLRAGAYGGSYETFLEDVREVWHNLRIAYGDQPDLMLQLESLSQNFESLYEKEVMNLVQKLAHHSGSEGLDVEIQKELNEVLLAGNNLPKAPWEDGVCKVCGIDKDDTSVLLCDKCDSEYHRYCLNPPLARIPDGDWFCPSCVADGQKVQRENHCTLAVTGHTRRNLGDETRAFREMMHQLASSMGVKEYWQFNTQERTFLLRFLCDEVLNSALIREHLEQCVDKSNSAQQKLYALTIDWRNLKCKEELLARTVKEQTGKSSGSRDIVREEGRAPIHANQGTLLEQQQHFMNRAIYTTNFSGSPLKRASAPLEEYHEENGQTDMNQNFGQLLKSMIDNHVNGRKHQNPQNLSDSMAAECGTHTVDSHVLSKATTNENPFFVINDNGLHGQEHSAVPLQQGITAATGEVVHDFDLGNARSMLIGVERITRDGLNAKEVPTMEGNGMVQPITDMLRGSHQSLDCGITHGNTLSMTLSSGASMSMGELFSSHQNTVLLGSHLDLPASLTELEASNFEVSSLRNEISLLQDSIANLESQVMSTSLRRDFLGRDSIGRLYWVIGKPGIRPWLVVGGSMNVPCEKRKTNEIGASSSCSTSDIASGSSFLGGTIYPSFSQSDCSVNCSMWNSSPLVLYESDTEIQQLVNWLRDSDPRERELKECILQWQRLAFYHGKINARIDPKPKSSIGEKLVSTSCLITKAAAVLENKYGPCLELEVSENPRKRGRKAKVNNEERMYRCECLEPVWPSRHHCLSCHQTFSFFKDLEDHNDGRCAPTIPAADESKETDDQVKGRGNRSDNTKGKESSGDADTVETLKKGKFDISSKLVKFPKKACPYDLAEISRKFITNDSNMELVKEIGLIGSNGLPSLISSPMFFDPPLILKQSKNFDTCANKGLASSDNRQPVSIQSEGANGSHGVVGNIHGHDAKSTENCRDSKGDHLLKTTFPYSASGKHESSKLQAEVTQNCTIPEPSLRPLVGRLSYILRWLKINLLDMEAALPEEALRHSKSHIMRRCAWRAFVKSAESIFEMIQATILLESMIKADYLKNGWWYWSSLSAAVNTSTISSLALRIYTLDDSIIYIKDNEPQTPASLDPATESLRITNKTTGKKRKDMTDGEPS